jgi:FkbM family methyltransferase
MPAFIPKPLGYAKAYAWRLWVWYEVAKHIKGQSEADRSIIHQALFRAPIDSLKDLSQWRDPTVASDCTVISALGRFHVRADSDDLFLTLPTREPGIVRTMQRLLRPGDCFVDAGANIGVYTVLGSKLVGETGCVVSVEMMPDTAAILREHIRDNGCGNVCVVETALSDSSGQTVRATVEPGKSGSASIAVKRDGRAVEVRTSTLAEVLAGTPSVRLMKMDLEGAELVALHGLTAAINKVWAVIFEDWSGGAVSEWLREAGFTFTRLDRNNSLATRAGAH